MEINRASMEATMTAWELERRQGAGEIFTIVAPHDDGLGYFTGASKGSTPNRYKPHTGAKQRAKAAKRARTP